jgi:hypothetical protein
MLNSVVSPFMAHFRSCPLFSCLAGYCVASAPLPTPSVTGQPSWIWKPVGISPRRRLSIDLRRFDDERYLDVHVILDDLAIADDG